MGSRSTTRHTPVPSLSVVVTAAAADSATNGSRACEYSRGSSAPPGHGVRRSAGICVCSGSQSDSKPRSSAALASSVTLMVYSVGKIVTPNFTAPSLVRSLGAPGGDGLLVGDTATREDIAHRLAVFGEPGVEDCHVPADAKVGDAHVEVTFGAFGVADLGARLDAALLGRLDDVF